MLSTIHRHKCPRKDKTSVQPLLKDKSMAISKDNELERSLTPPSPSVNPIKPDILTNLVLKYFG